MITVRYINDLVKDAIEGDDLFIVDVSVDLNGKIRVVLDSDSTVAIADCISVNRAIEQHLDRDEEDFSLEVTSAGLGQPLTMLRQYHKYIGKALEVTVDSGTKLSGKLKTVNEEFIELLEEEKKSKKSKKTRNKLDTLQLHKLAINSIKKATAVVTI
ncbi:MAG: ribosome assembly cofactor RimP [Flavobacteriales bacterium]|nr:ribosome assembly cofactor RimP [Flavobacteriales bacterium]